MRSSLLFKKAKNSRSKVFEFRDPILINYFTGTINNLSRYRKPWSNLER